MSEDCPREPAGQRRARRTAAALKQLGRFLRPVLAELMVCLIASLFVAVGYVFAVEFLLWWVR